MTPKNWRGKVFIATSLDGYIALPDGDIEWLTDPPTEIEHPAPLTAAAVLPTGDYEAFIATIDHVVMGRGTYEKITTFDSWPFSGKTVIVVSTVLAGTIQPHGVVAVASVEGATTLLAENHARGVYVDGGALIQSFLREGLIDDITLTRAPIVLGSGLPLFGALDSPIRLALQETAVTENGLTHASYTVLR
jgi:dihydrofolate reductase